VAHKEAFQDLFGISCAKNGFCCNSQFFNGFDQWTVSFAIATHDWEVRVLASRCCIQLE
jgi:hypothetical protein